MNNIRVENWCGYNIRFVEINGEWWAILKDICDALKLHTFKIAQRLDPSMLERVPIEIERTSVRPTRYGEEFHDHPSKGVVKNHDIPSKYSMKNHEDGSTDIVKSNFTVHMLAVNELGIYEALFASRRLEARKFRMWAGTVMQKLRKNVGLQQYEVMRMTEPDIQDEIDCILDSLYWDEERGYLMQSVTVQGGDVDQVPFE